MEVGGRWLEQDTDPKVRTPYVDDKCFLTAYQPVRDAADRVVGTLYVGVPPQGISTVRDALLGEDVGGHGSVTVLGMTGDR